MKHKIVYDTQIDYFREAYNVNDICDINVHFTTIL